ncbi:MAG: 2-thiouracil desulfurase family protein [Desulfobulbaceae bacterium]
MVLVSACLAGLCTRYDGRLRPSPDCMAALTGTHWLPVCPEQLGGLPTPRPAADLIGGDGNAVLAGRARVLTREGRDVTSHFCHGARQCLALALAQNIRRAYLKSGSPSCGLSPRPGVTAALLLQNGIEVIEYR